MRTKSEILDGYNTVEFLLKCKLSFKFFAEHMLKYTSDGRRIKIPKFQERWVMLAESKNRLIMNRRAKFFSVLMAFMVLGVYAKTVKINEKDIEKKIRGTNRIIKDA